MSGYAKRGTVAVKWRDAQAAIAERCTPEPSTGCWLWTESLGSTGYGECWSTRRGRSIKASRVSFEAFKGTIPEGMFVCHRCDQPSCVNPAHLWLGTQSDNMRDAMSKGRTRGIVTNPSRGVDQHCAKLDDITVECMRVGIASGAHSQADWVRWLGVRPCTLSEAYRSKTWRHVTNRFEVA